MSERAPVGPTPVEQRLDELLRLFEARSEWRLSLPAKIVLLQTILSLRTDIIGMGELTTPEGRRYAINRAFETLPSFLDHLTKEATPLASEAAQRDKMEKETRDIGAIFVLQHVPTWAITMFGCGCWPRLHQ